LDDLDMVWEASEHSPATETRHRALVSAATEDEAIRLLREALAAHGSFHHLSLNR
jgi:hypothetical protein